MPYVVNEQVVTGVFGGMLFITAFAGLIAWGTFSSKNGDPQPYLANRGKPKPEVLDDWSNMMKLTDFLPSPRCMGKVECLKD